ncbi:MAG: DNA polymerase III subunit gamma/tau [Clostridia bacterium]|nr:DNA polymerase III subunit gamma/tau [Clostridia bacterium]
MHQTLYRKWRPSTFDDVCGQEHVTSILRYQVEEGKTSHAYLFCGSRGTGKTTCAKLLARALNCEHPINGSPCGVCDTCKGILSGAITDVIEMDAASNNGVDNIRDIREDVAYAPSECKKRVFIIDEVHMLSVSAFNALLKTLEEPPEHIVFILATTEMHKIPATILSRCQRYDFRRIASSVIVSRLRTIADSEGIRIDDDALSLIAKLSAGGMRDAIGMLELCAGAASAEEETVDAAKAAALLGTSPVEETAAVADAIMRHDIAAVFSMVDKLYREARDIGVFWQSMISFYRDILVCKTVADPTPLLDLTERQMALPQKLAQRVSLETLLYHTRVLDETFSVLQKSAAPARVVAEMALVRLCDNTLDTANSALLARLSALEEKVAINGMHMRAGEPIGQERIPAKADTVYDIAEDMIPPEEPEMTPPWDAPQQNTEASVPAEQEKQVKKNAVSAIAAGSAAAKKEFVTDAQPKAENQAKKVLRAFGAWQQVMSRLEKHNPLTASFLRECKAYTCAEDGKFHVRAANAFSVKLITSKKENIEQLLSMINVVSQDQRYTEADLVIESTDTKKNDGYEMIDDIIENAGLNTP